MSDRVEYQRWLSSVVDARRQHEQRMAQLMARQASLDDTVLADIITRLLQMRRAVTEQCRGTWTQRIALQGIGAAQQTLVQFLNQLRYFLKNYDRFEQYGLLPTDLRTDNFVDRRFVDTLCSRLRRGINRELGFAVRKRLGDWLATVPIGGREQRRYDVDAIVRFVLDNRLESSTPDEIYAQFVQQRLRDAEAAIGVESPELSVESFELLGGGSEERQPGGLSASVFAPTLPEQRKLSANNQLCRERCRFDKRRGAKVCATEPYTYYGMQYDWDYC